MTELTKQGFRPSESLIRVGEALMVAMAFEQHVRPIVEAYEEAILAKHQFMSADRWREHMEPKPILKRKEAFLLGDEDHKVYIAECFAARDAAGLKVSRPENCPLLEAEYLRVNGENAFISELGEIEGLETFKRNNGILTLDQRKMIIDIGLKLIAPFVGKSDDVLRRYMKD